jgi:hypothetical protein
MTKGIKPKAKKSRIPQKAESYEERRPGMLKNKKGQTPLEAQGLVDKKGNLLPKNRKNKTTKKAKGGKIGGAPHNRLY